MPNWVRGDIEKWTISRFFTKISNGHNFFNTQRRMMVDDFLSLVGTTTFRIASLAVLRPLSAEHEGEKSENVVKC